MKNKGHVISNIVPESIADELSLESGDQLISINNHEIEDVFDYQFFVEDESIVLLVEKANGEEWELEIEKDFEEKVPVIHLTQLVGLYLGLDPIDDLGLDMNKIPILPLLKEKLAPQK